MGLRVKTFGVPEWFLPGPKSMEHDGFWALVDNFGHVFCVVSLTWGPGKCGGSPHETAKAQRIVGTEMWSCSRFAGFFGSILR